MLVAVLCRRAPEGAAGDRDRNRGMVVARPFFFRVMASRDESLNRWFSPGPGTGTASTGKSDGDDDVDEGCLVLLGGSKSKNGRPGLACSRNWSSRGSVIKGFKQLLFVAAAIVEIGGYAGEVKT